jgi:hypothetical protein
MNSCKKNGRKLRHEGDLSEFQKRYDLVDVNATSESVTQRLSRCWLTKTAAGRAYRPRPPLRKSAEQVGFDPNTAIRVANLNESPTYQALLEDLREIEQTIAPSRCPLSQPTLP